jgi:hypothetical protein
MKPIPALAALAVLVAWSCMQPHRPDVTPARTGVTVNASFGRTWDAALAAFAARNVQVNPDRMSGTIASNATEVTVADTGGRDCGTSSEGNTLRPNAVRYRILVKGDSTASTLLANAIYGRLNVTALQECGSRGVWEAAFEAEVKQRAEQR